MIGHEKITAILPAYNEGANIGNVLKTLLSAKREGIIDEVIVVDDGSADETAEISEGLGAKVIKVFPNQGKGNAMREGVKNTNAEIIVFFDADLIELTAEHILGLIKPIVEKEKVMCVGVRERGGWRGKISEFFIKIDPLSAISGERAMRRFVFESVPFRFIKGFMVETALNYYCLINKLPVSYLKLRNLDIVIKERKWGLIRGFLNRIKMSWQLFKIRILIWKNKKEFLTQKQSGSL